MMALSDTQVENLELENKNVKSAFLRDAEKLLENKHFKFIILLYGYSSWIFTLISSKTYAKLELWFEQ